MQRAQGSIKHGQAAQWVVTVYATGAGTTNASVAVSATPARPGASFDFGCGPQDGTTACSLGRVTASSPIRQVQAQVTVPATSAATSVRLTAVVSADHLPVKPRASVTVLVAAGIGAPHPPVNFLNNPAFRSPAFLPAGLRSTASTSLIPGGNAAGLFPELQPGTQPGSGSVNGTRLRASNAAALTSAGLSTMSAQLAGLAALALALALTAVPKLRTRVIAIPRLLAASRRQHK